MDLSRTAPTGTRSPRVVYVGGLGRSGSTLIELVLNSLPGFVAVGELRYIWQQGLKQDLLCACGQPFFRCEFWTAVGDHAFGGWQQLDTARVMSLADAVDRHRYIPLLLHPDAFSRFERRLSEYRSILAKIYEAVSAISGQDLIVDSTKDPPFAFIVRGMFGENFRLVHLVRDSRGVAYSWMRHKRRPEVADKEAWMERYGPANAAVRWLDYNVLFDFLTMLGTPSILVRYEDLVHDPYASIARIVDHAGAPVDRGFLREVLSGDVPASQSHSVAGNPIRFDRGPLRFRFDDEWVRSMKPRDRLVVTALTAPLLRRYGYSRPLAARGKQPRALAAGQSLP